MRWNLKEGGGNLWSDEQKSHEATVKDNSLEAPNRVTLYHKHKAKDKYYHRHRECRTVQEAVEQIKSHDRYVLEQQSKKQEKQKAPAASRRLKVYEQNGYKYQPTPTIQLKGKWLEEYGFSVGTEINVACADGILTITASPLQDGLVKARTSDTTATTAYNTWYDEVYMPSNS